MDPVAALLHGPDLPASGAPGRIAFEGDVLRVIRDDGDTLAIPAATLDVGVTGFNEDTLQLSWEQEGRIHAVTVADPAAHRELMAHAPPGLTRKLAGGHSAIHYHRRKWNLFVGILGSLALLVGLVWWQSEAVTQWIANRVPLETEIRIGDRALAQLEQEYALTKEGTAPAALASIGARLTSKSRYQYRWYVSAEREVNAYALPGGIIVVNAGMIDAAANAEELAGVLAHEVQHVEQRHTLQQMIHTAGWAAVLAVVLGDVSAITAIVVHQLGDLRNSRKLETQADVEGMKALARAGIPLQGMADLFRKLQAENERRGGEGIALLSSHPATVERIADLEQLAKTLKCDCKPLAVDWKSIQTATQEWRAAQ
jgi:Zn-dependent protease with chaperone function